MARFERSGAAQGPVVGGFGDGGFFVGGATYRAVLLSPLWVEEWEPPSLDELTPGTFGALLEVKPTPEFLILGTGATHRFPPRPLVSALETSGIGIETMDSRAAARTWGLLRGDERWIVAALMPLI